MAVTARKYNPGFLSDDELVASFCVRTHEFASVVEMLRECTGSSNTHQIVIGPRGSGKTSLLLRIAAEVRRDAELRSNFFPIVFAEESYEVATAGEFWLESLSRLAAQAPRGDGGPDLRRTFDELRTIRDDRTLGDRCLGALQDFSDREGKRLVLMVENLNMMFRDMSDPDAGWRLRHALQTEPRIVLLASATSRFDEIDDPEHALYEQLRVILLRPLDTNECAVLWETVSGLCPPPEKIRALEILTGGNPRLLTIVARFGAELSFRKLMASVLDLVDDHTEYFKSHLESLPAQERRVYLALATLWKPATTREISDQARMETSKCSAQLTRLIGRGVVQSAGGSARRKQYYLTERLYNIYYLLRRSRRSDRLVEALIHFMESYYSPSELKDIGARIIGEAESFSAEMQSLSQATLARLMELPAMAECREELLAMISEGFSEVTSQGSVPVDMARMAQAGMRPDSHWAVQLHKSTGEEDEQAAKQLFASAVALNRQDRAQEALAVCDETIWRCEESENPAIAHWVAMALFMKGCVLDKMNRAADAVAVYDEVVRRFEEDETPTLVQWVANALLRKGALLSGMKRPHDALAAYDEVVRRFGEDETLTLVEEVSQALVEKGALLCEMKRPHDTLAACDEVVSRLEEDKIPHLIERVAQALVRKEALPSEVKRPRHAVVVFERLLRLFGDGEPPVFVGSVLYAILRKWDLLGEMNWLDNTLAVLEDVVGRFEEDETPALAERVAQALVMKGLVLNRLNRAADALSAYDEAVHRFGESEFPALHQWVREALLGRTEVELKSRQFEAAAETIGRLLDQSQSELEKQLRSDLIRAKATLANGDRSACEREIEAVLALLPEIRSLPRDSLDALIFFSVALGPERMCELIKASPSASLLLPLTTALERELGLETRVAREVEEVADDIRRNLAKLREAETDGIK